MILATASFLLSVSQLSPPRLAFAARFYKQGKAKSRIELYVSDLGAGHRRLLPTTEVPVNVIWLDTNRLAWFSGYEDRNRHYWVSSIRHWAPKLSMEGANRLAIASREAIVPVTGGKEVLPEEGVGEHLTMSNVEDKLPASRVGWLTLKSGQKTWKFENEALHIWKTQNGRRLWVLSGYRPTGFLEIDELSLWEKGLSPRTIFSNAGQYDFREDRDIYAFRTPFITRKLNDGRHVWVTDLHVGNWTRRTEKTVIQGLAEIIAVSVRPRK